VAAPAFIELGGKRHATRIPILFEDRSAIVVDKPAGWMLIPFSWQATQRNLQAAITSSIAAGDYWARSRNLKFLRAAHRLDADTTGILLLAKSLGAVDAYGDLFESRQMSKRYLAVVDSVPARQAWSCRARLGPVPGQPGRMMVDPRQGKEAETEFQVLQVRGSMSLIEARPLTGRTHQIRLHLLEAGCPIVGDSLYGTQARHPKPGRSRQLDPFPLGLRAVSLEYRDPFQRKPVCVRAPANEFLSAFGFESEDPPQSRGSRAG